MTKHPAYSSDLSPSDYHLFRSTGHFIAGNSFRNVQEVEISVRELFASKPAEWYRAGIENVFQKGGNNALIKNAEIVTLLI